MPYIPTSPTLYSHNKSTLAKTISAKPGQTIRDKIFELKAKSNIEVDDYIFKNDSEFSLTITAESDDDITKILTCLQFYQLKFDNDSLHGTFNIKI
ncbi:hypothetical protein DID78_06185 [Candidatus Marinamargulisbacteria bacterium SCGC AG-343-D04]|nr:hypothetical protein DID78_06185 [Candidatus Marinamargulisbacteria bacterium SCGC AG-343-D04]